MARPPDVSPLPAMHVGIAARHPEHVRFFRHPIEELLDDGLDVRVYARESGPTTDLLDRYGLPYERLADEGTTTTGHLAGHAAYEARLLAAARRREAAVLASVGGRAITHLAPVAGARSVAFLDWSPGPVDRLVGRLADVVCAPECIDDVPGSRRVRYPGCHELSYLHPDRFEPDPSAAARPGVDPDDRSFVLGFRDPDRRAGLDRPIAERVDERLAEYGSISYVREHAAPRTPELQRHAADGGTATVPPAARPHVLAHADLCVGDSALLATEAAVLGTPAVLLHGGAAPARVAALQDRYGLLHATDDGQELLDQLAAVVTDDGTADLWRDRREQLLDESTDVARLAADVLAREARRAAR